MQAFDWLTNLFEGEIVLGRTNWNLGLKARTMADERRNRLCKQRVGLESYPAPFIAR